MTDLYCMSFTSKGTSEILVAGAQDTMFVVDVNKGEILKQAGPIATPPAPGRPNLTLPTNSSSFLPSISTPS